MHALGCSADDALERMRQVSQRTNLRATEVAQRIIDAHSRPDDRGGTPAPAASNRTSPAASGGEPQSDPEGALARLAELAVRSAEGGSGAH